MARIPNPFSFLFSKPQKEELVVEYVIREHHKGRSLTEILEYHYVTNRFSADQVQRVLDHPEVIHAVGEDTIAAIRGSSI